MKHFYRTQGVCAQAIEFDLEDGIIRNVQFYGGCNGNLNGITKLVEGKPAAEIVDLLDGNLCGGKWTSCPDQLSRALRIALEEEAEAQE